jgi:hypothetical protein
VVAAPYVT